MEGPIIDLEEVPDPTQITIPYFKQNNYGKESSEQTIYKVETIYSKKEFDGIWQSAREEIFQQRTGARRRRERDSFESFQGNFKKGGVEIRRETLHKGFWKGQEEA